MFTVIGERINTTLKKVKAAVTDRDADYIMDDVQKQTAAGASYIDVNAGARIGHEVEDMTWLLEVVQQATDLPLCLDSPDPAVLEMAYGLVSKKPMINSISLEKDRFEPMIEYLQGKDCRIIALCMDDTGMPSSSEDIAGRARNPSPICSRSRGPRSSREDSSPVPPPDTPSATPSGPVAHRP